MKWESVTSTIGHNAYALWNNGRKLVTLVFNPSSNAARIEYENEKRVFLIRKEGFLRNKTVVRNEYGVRIGHSGSENNEHFIVVNDERYFYSINDHAETAITLYKDTIDKPLAVFGMDMDKAVPSKKIIKNRSIQDKAHYSLLVALCWFLFRPDGEVAPEFIL